MKEICPNCGADVRGGGISQSLFAIIGPGLSIRCPGCSTEVELSAGDAEPYDPGPIAPDDPLAPWHRDRALGIPTAQLPHYDAGRSTWTVYGEAVESYAAATARIDNVKAGLTPRGEFDEVGASLDAFLAARGASEAPDGASIARSRRLPDVS